MVCLCYNSEEDTRYNCEMNGVVEGGEKKRGRIGKRNVIGE